MGKAKQSTGAHMAQGNTCQVLTTNMTTQARGQ